MYYVPTVDEMEARASFVCSAVAGDEGGEGGGGEGVVKGWLTRFSAVCVPT